MPHPTATSSRAARAGELADAVLGDDAIAARLDHLVQIAVERIGADAGQISMLSDGVVSLCPAGAFSGVVAPGTRHPFEETLCANVLRADDTLVIPNARADQRVAGTAAVANGQVGAYLGAPIRTPAGGMVGVLCLFSQQARDWNAAEQADLDELADRVAAELEH